MFGSSAAQYVVVVLGIRRFAMGIMAGFAIGIIAIFLLFITWEVRQRLYDMTLATDTSFHGAS
jgi:hypothetical protein